MKCYKISDSDSLCINQNIHTGKLFTGVVVYLRGLHKALGLVSSIEGKKKEEENEEDGKEEEGRKKREMRKEGKKGMKEGRKEGRDEGAKKVQRDLEELGKSLLCKHHRGWG